MSLIIPKLEGTWGRVRPFRNQKRAWLVALLGIACTLSGAAWLRASELKQSRAAFERRAQNMQLAMRARFDTPLSTLQAVPPFFGASREVETREFAAFVHSALLHTRGIEFIAWAPELMAAERASFERLATRLEWPDFVVRDMTSRRELQTAPQRDRYMPLLHIEPKGTPLLGLDLLGDPVRARAVERAFRAEEHMASPGLDDMREGPNESLLVFAPLTEVVAVSSDPRAPRRGVAVLGLRVVPLLQASVTRASFLGLDLVLFDRTPGEPERLLFESSPGAATLDPGEKDVFELRAPYCGRVWAWRFHAHAGTITAGSGPSILALFGCILSLVATFAVGSFEVVRRLRVEVTAATQLGQYRLVRKLGEGGMGVVYQAEHALLRRPTAIKLIAAKGSRDSNLIARFEREVKATSRLSHPNTIAVYDFGRSPDGVFYYAMEFLPGLSAEALVRAVGPLPPARVVHFLKQVCGSLSEAHAQGFVHRDVKPGNLIICERGGIADFVKVLDFGLVKDVSLREATKYSQAGQMFGTPQYMAPESFLNTVRASPLVDIYAVGAVAYFMLSGHDVFEANSITELITLQLEGTIAPPSKAMHRALPPDLEAVVMRCLSREPSARPSSAEELFELLDKCEIPRWTQADARAFWTQHSALIESSRPHSGDTAWSETLAVDLAPRKVQAQQIL